MSNKRNRRTKPTGSRGIVHHLIIPDMKPLDYLEPEKPAKKPITLAKVNWIKRVDERLKKIS